MKRNPFHLAGCRRVLTAMLYASALVLAGQSLAAGTSASVVRSYQLGPTGLLELTALSSWNGQLAAPEEGKPPSLIFKPESGAGFIVQINLLVRPTPDTPKPDSKQIKIDVASGAEMVRLEAEETVIPIQEIQGTNGLGYYFSVTDREPKPDDYKYMTRGMLPVDDMIMAFTILTNDDTRPVIPSALTLLRSARLVKPVKR